MGRPSTLAICWRSVRKVARGSRRSASRQATMSSPDGVGRPEPHDGVRPEEPLTHDAIEQGQGVAVEVTRRRAQARIVQDRRVGAAQLPGREERRPVDDLAELVERVAREGPQADEGGARGIDLRPVDPQAVGAGLVQARPALPLPLAGPFAADALVLLADPRHEAVVPVGLHERAGDADGARGIQHVDHGPRVRGGDLHRGVGAGRRRAADQQGDREALAFHLPGDVGHLLQRRRDQAREADEVGLQLDRLLQDAGGRHHDPQVHDLVVVAAKHDADDVLADVVDVALDGGHDDRARAAAGAGPLGLQVRHQDGHGLLHHAGALHDLRQEHAAGAEQVADHVHAGHERPLDDVQRAGALPAAPPPCRPRSRRRSRPRGRGSAARRRAGPARPDLPPRGPCRRCRRRTRPAPANARSRRGGGPARHPRPAHGAPARCRRRWAGRRR